MKRSGVSLVSARNWTPVNAGARVRRVVGDIMAGSRPDGRQIALAGAAKGLVNVWSPYRINGKAHGGRGPQGIQEIPANLFARIGGGNVTPKKRRIVRAALVKAVFEWGDPQANMKLLEKLAAPLADAKVDVLITPECFLDGYMIRNRKRVTTKKLAKCCVGGLSDRYLRRARRLAQRIGSYIVFGASQLDRQGIVRNAAFLFGRRGEHVGTYYKVQPDHFYRPGEELPVFETDFGKVGIVICADRRWPEVMRCLRLKGAEIILNPTWGNHGERNTAIMRTRAYENGIPVCFAHPEQALICLPDGSIGAVLESSEACVLVHDVDLTRNKEAKSTEDKARSHPVQNRRPELYGAIVEPISEGI